MSDLAPLVLSVIKDKTMKEEIDQLAAEVAKLKTARDDLLDHAIRHDDSVEITISINRKIYAQGSLPTLPDYHGGTREVQFNVTKKFKGGIEMARNIEIRLNGMVLAKGKDAKELDGWREGTIEMKLICYQIDPPEHNVKPWRWESLLLYAQEETLSNNQRQMYFTSVSLE